MTELSQMSIDDVDTATRWLDAFEDGKRAAQKAADERAKAGG